MQLKTACLGMVFTVNKVNPLGDETIPTRNGPFGEPNSTVGPVTKRDG